VNFPCSFSNPRRKYLCQFDAVPGLFHVVVVFVVGVFGIGIAPVAEILLGVGIILSVAVEWCAVYYYGGFNCIG